MRPRKYFCATMFVAVCDQNFGNSTSFCSKAGPSLPGISASRVSHSISSNGTRPDACLALVDADVIGQALKAGGHLVPADAWWPREGAASVGRVLDRELHLDQDVPGRHRRDGLVWQAGQAVARRDRRDDARDLGAACGFHTRTRVDGSRAHVPVGGGLETDWLETCGCRVRVLHRNEDTACEGERRQTDEVGPVD